MRLVFHCQKKNHLGLAGSFNINPVRHGLFWSMKEGFNWRKGGSFRWIPPPPKEDDLKIKSWVQTNYKQFKTNNWIYEKILVHDHTWAPPPHFFRQISTIYIHLLPPNTEKAGESLTFSTMTRLSPMPFESGVRCNFCCCKMDPLKVPGVDQLMTPWQEIGWFLGWFSCTFKKGKSIWIFDLGVVWFDGKSPEIEKTRCEIQSFQTIDLFFFWVLAVPFPNSPWPGMYTTLCNRRNPAGSTDPLIQPLLQERSHT